MQAPLPVSFMKKITALSAICFSCMLVYAQTDSLVNSKFASAKERARFRNNIINRSIIQSLSVPLTDSTEDNWEDAFTSMELLRYKTPWVDAKIKKAFSGIKNRSISFQRTALEMAYALYPAGFRDSVYSLALNTIDIKTYAMAVEYLAQKDYLGKMSLTAMAILQRHSFLSNMAVTPSDKELLKMLMLSVSSASKPSTKIIRELLRKDYLPGNTIIFSFQRKNRNFPGLAVVRDKEGNFIKNADGKIFSVPQLARSKSNMPVYITNGSTPQGIFRMDGFDVSKSAMIGPTQNIQLTMPFETSIGHFLKDSTISDTTTWTEDYYQRLLPAKFKDFQPLMQTYFASQIGRTEIIAHGTTVDAAYYKGQPYYPQTPTEGCLCTKESWDANGNRLESDQQKLVNAVKLAGGPDGYIIVLEIDDQQKPVTLADIFPPGKTK